MEKTVPVLEQIPARAERHLGQVLHRTVDCLDELQEEPQRGRAVQSLGCYFWEVVRIAAQGD